MGRLKTNILDAATGKIGNVVVYEMYGKTYIRSKPDRIKDRKSPAQLAQRRKMVLMIDFLRPFIKLIRVTYAHEAVGRSAYQAAQSYNLKNAIEGIYPDQMVSPNKALLSVGSVILPETITVTKKEEGLLFEWDPTFHPQANNKDTLVVIARERERHFVDYRVTGARRSDKSYFWPTELFTYGAIDVWIAFRSHQEDDMSDSLYLGSLCENYGLELEKV